MNSCLYRAQVMHHRLEPKQHRFHYNVFMFYLDLSEIDAIARKFLFISRNKFNYFSFNRHPVLLNQDHFLIAGHGDHHDHAGRIRPLHKFPNPLPEQPDEFPLVNNFSFLIHLL